MSTQGKDRPWVLLLIFLAGTGVVICSLLLLLLGRAVDDEQKAINQLNDQVAINGELISELQQRDAALEQVQEEALLRESVLLLLVQGLQDQVRDLGGDPLPVPPDLQGLLVQPREPRGDGSSTRRGPGSSGRAPSSPSPGQAPRPSPSPSSSPSPPPSPSPSPSPSQCVPGTGICLPGLPSVGRL